MLRLNIKVDIQRGVAWTSTSSPWYRRPTHSLLGTQQCETIGELG